MIEYRYEGVVREQNSPFINLSLGGGAHGTEDPSTWITLPPSKKQIAAAQAQAAKAAQLPAAPTPERLVILLTGRDAELLFNVNGENPTISMPSRA